MSDALQKAVAAHRAGDLRSAEPFYASHLASFPNDVDALYMLGVLFLQSGRPQKAEEVLTSAIMNNPNHGRAFYSLGRACSLLGRGDDAVAHFRASLDSGLRQADTFLELAVQLDELGRLNDAESIAREGTDAFPHDPRVVHSLARIQLRRGFTDEAISLFETAAHLSEEQVEFLFSLGIALVQTGRDEEAIGVFRKVTAKAPGMWSAHAKLGNALLVCGRFDEATKTFSEATRTRRRPTNPTDQWSDVSRSHTRPYKLRHDIEQFHYLRSLGLETERFAWLAREYETLLGDLGSTQDESSVLLPDAFRKNHWEHYNCALHVADGAVPADGTINPALDRRETERLYGSRSPNYVVVDDLLTTDAWRALYDFCLKSTIWYDFRHDGYVGASLEDGFVPPVLLDLAKRLPQAFPAIFGDHRLMKIWAYKYDNDMRAIGPHADFAAVNVNIWLTPTNASTDPSRAGLRLYTVAAPLEWGFDEYNNINSDGIREYLSKNQSEAIDIGFRCNRATIFDSNLFHESGELNFHSGYENRRINVTLLYGFREDVSTATEPGRPIRSSG